VGILTSSSNILLSVPFAQFSGADDSGPNVPIHLRDCRGYPGVGSASARGLVPRRIILSDTIGSPETGHSRIRGLMRSIQQGELRRTFSQSPAKMIFHSINGL
jgi:hypothetical protein